MTSTTIMRTLMLTLFCATLAACGRAGAPELPPSTVVEGKDRVQQPPTKDRPFVLDPLLN